MDRAPRVGVLQVLGQPAERVIDSRVERHLGGPPLELLGRQPLEELDRVVIDLAPQRRVQLAKQRDHVRLPGPPEVPGQLTKLIDQLRLTDHGHTPSARRFATPRLLDRTDAAARPPDRVTVPRRHSALKQKQHSISNDPRHAKTDTMKKGGGRRAEGGGMKMQDRPGPGRSKGEWRYTWLGPSFLGGGVGRPAPARWLTAPIEVNVAEPRRGLSERPTSTDFLPHSLLRPSSQGRLAVRGDANTAHTQGGPKVPTCDTALVALDLRMSLTLFGTGWLAT